jgi:Tautomerase enzyme
MPVVKIHVESNVYQQSRLEKMSQAVHSTLVDLLKTPPDDFFQIIFEKPNTHFFHPPSFLGRTYSKEFILLEVTVGATKERGTPEAKAALLKELDRRVASEASISPDDLMIMLYEIAYDSVSFGRGLAGVGKV